MVTDNDDLVAVIGADCRAKALFGNQGCDPAALANLTDANPPLIGSGVRNAAGPTGVLHTDIGDRSLQGAPVVTDFDNVNGGRVVLYPLQVAQTLFARPNGLDAIFVVPKPGVTTSQLQASLSVVVGEQNKVLTATEPGSDIAFVSSQLLPFLFLISLFGLAVGGQLVFNTMTLSLEERRREMAIAAAIGGTPGTVTTGVLAEAAVLGIAGGAVGIGMGLLVAKPFVANFSKFAEQSAGIHLSVHPTLASVVIGLGIGVLASVAAAAIPARRAARIDIAGELVDRTRRQDASTRIRARRSVVLAVFVGAGLLMAWLGAKDGGLQSWQPNLLLVGVVLSFGSSFPFPPALAPYAVRWIEKIPVLQRGPARIAVSNLVTETRRTSAVLTAIGAAVGMAFVLGGVLPGMAEGARRLARDSAGDRVIVTTLGLNNTAAIDAKLSPDVQSALEAFPGVAGGRPRVLRVIRLSRCGSRRPHGDRWPARPLHGVRRGRRRRSSSTGTRDDWSRFGPQASPASRKHIQLARALRRRDADGRGHLGRPRHDRRRHQRVDKGVREHRRTASRLPGSARTPSRSFAVGTRRHAFVRLISRPTSKSSIPTRPRPASPPTSRSFSRRSGCSLEDCWWSRSSPPRRRCCSRA